LLFSVLLPMVFLLLLGQKRRGRYENNDKNRGNAEVNEEG
jgi:hypothetical protein